jgi:thioredoxin reductase (NADPH)
VLYDCLIIGAGPAGITAAVQLKRSGHSVALIEKDRIGGLLLNARKVENYLGFVDGISGPDLVKHFEDQLKKFEIEVVKAEVKNISKEDNFVIKTDADEMTSKTVILATGTKPKIAGIKGEEELAGDKLFYEVRDIPKLPSGSTFLVIGGGDAAFDYTLSLDDRGYKPRIITRGKAQCLSLLLDEVKKRGIEYMEDAMLPDDLKNIKEDYVLIAVGREPDFPGKIPEAEGLYIAGDAHGGIERQVHIATGDALKVAMNVSRYLKNC